MTEWIRSYFFLLVRFYIEITSVKFPSANLCLQGDTSTTDVEIYAYLKRCVSVDIDSQRSRTHAPGVGDNSESNIKPLWKEFHGPVSAAQQLYLEMEIQCA